MRKGLGSVMGVAACAALLMDARPAAACGGLSPPAVAEGEYAVNQSAAQIIFEVEPGWVTAHVLIKYAGEPEKFAWIVPVPEAPELAISPITAFGLLDRETAPRISVLDQDICPISEYRCAFPEVSSCGGVAAGDDAPIVLDAGVSSDAPGGETSPVDVIETKVVGDYETVTFRASEAAGAMQWLRDNGFIVNSTTSIYLEPYVDANMVFVAAKLVPGAGASSIKPLRMRYRAPFPQVPLVLTAVAAEPHLTVTALIYANSPFKPQGHPIVQIDSTRIARDETGRTNYPMVLARTIDEAGGDGFVVEYRGETSRPELGGTSSFCCATQHDSCNFENDDQCQCPRAEFDYQDCKDTSDIIDGVRLLDELAAKYPVLTRITTRISAEEMTFDPAFEADFTAPQTGRLGISATQPSLSGCRLDVIDQTELARIWATQSCATTYCGAGTCAMTESGAACACDAGFVAQQFDDLDGVPSVTCVPQTPPVDLRAGGDVLPDACADVSCGAGLCMDRNGIAVCACNTDAAAVRGEGGRPRCEPVLSSTQTPGAEDFSDPLRDLEVCAPAPPQCGLDGWLVTQTSARPGVACGDHAKPSPTELIPKPGRRCGSGCLGCSTGDGSPIGVLAGAWAVLGLLGVRRRRR